MNKLIFHFSRARLTIDPIVHHHSTISNHIARTQVILSTIFHWCLYRSHIVPLRCLQLVDGLICTQIRLLALIYCCVAVRVRTSGLFCSLHADTFLGTDIQDNHLRLSQSTDWHWHTPATRHNMHHICMYEIHKLYRYSLSTKSRFE